MSTSWFLVKVRLDIQHSKILFRYPDCILPKAGPGGYVGFLVGGVWSIREMQGHGDQLKISGLDLEVLVIHLLDGLRISQF